MSVTKLCRKCGDEKPIDQFNWKDKKKGKRQTQCKACHAAYRRQHYQDNKEKYKEKARRWNRENMEEYRMKMRRYVFDYLLGHPCVDCGETNPIVLDFDHVRGEKIMEISVMLGSMAKLERIQAEIDKCDVRCANCHRIKTAKQRGWHSVTFMAELGIEF